MSNGTAGTRQQTWALMNGGQSGLFDRDRSNDNLFIGNSRALDKSAIELAPIDLPTLRPATGALAQFAGSGGQSIAFVPPGYVATDPNINPKTGQKWTADELAGITTSGATSTDDSQFYSGGLGLPAWGVNAAKTGLSVFGALNGIPAPITKVVGALLGPVLGEEGINEHTLTNSALDAGLSLNPITGLLNMGGKAIAGLLGEKYDLANTLGEATGTYALRSLDSLNLESFKNDSDAAYAGFNQRTLAEIARQEALNAQEHVQRQQDEYLAQHDLAAAQRAQAAISGSPLTQLSELANQNTFDGGSAYGVTGYGPTPTESTSSGTSGNAGTQSNSYGYSNPASSYGGW